MQLLECNGEREREREGWEGGVRRRGGEEGYIRREGEVWGTQKNSNEGGLPVDTKKNRVPKDQTEGDLKQHQQSQTHTHTHRLKEKDTYGSGNLYDCPLPDFKLRSCRCQNDGRGHGVVNEGAIYARNLRLCSGKLRFPPITRSSSSSHILLFAILTSCYPTLCVSR